MVVLQVLGALTLFSRLHVTSCAMVVHLLVTSKDLHMGVINRVCCCCCFCLFVCCWVFCLFVYFAVWVGGGGCFVFCLFSF